MLRRAVGQAIAPPPGEPIPATIVTNQPTTLVNEGQLMTASTERPVRFAAIGLDHAHIFGLISGLLANGCELVGISSDDPDAATAKEVRQRWPEARWVADPGELTETEPSTWL